MEESTFLVTVHRVIGRIEVEPDLPRRPAMRLHKQLDQQLIEFLGARDDAFVATARRFPGFTQLQAVQGARTGQGVASVALSHPLVPRHVRFAHQHREQRIIAQRIMVIEVFVSQGNRVDALGHQFIDAMFNARAIAVIHKTPRHPRRHPDTEAYLAKQHSSAVGADATAIKSTRHRAASQGVKLKLFDSTLCLQGCFLFDWHKRLIAQTLCHEEQLFSTPSVIFPG